MKHTRERKLNLKQPKEDHSQNKIEINEIDIYICFFLQKKVSYIDKPLVEKTR